MSKVFAVTVVAALLLLAACTASPQKEGNNGKVRIGAPDDTGGMIIHYLINDKGYGNAETQCDFDMYPVKDCCASTSQWALSTNLYDIAVMCPDAAAGLLEKDRRFEIISPCLVNSDIVVARPGDRHQKIGVAQNRSHQEQIAADVFGPDVSTAPMLPAAIPYAYEKKAVDAVVVDALRGFTMDGEKIPAFTAAGGHVTYVLVVNKSFKSEPRYQQFIGLFKAAVEELNDPAVLTEEVRKYKNIEFTREEVEQWNRLGIKHVFSTQETQG